MIKKLNIDERQKRFDGEMETHYHISCLSCGRIDDVSLDFFIEPGKLLEGKTDYDVDGYELVFSGFCGKCKNSSRKNMGKLQ